jgi:hypothetical protein
MLDEGESDLAMDTATPTARPGQLDAELVLTARDAHAVEKVQIRAGADGSVTKIAVYHGDAERVPEPVRKLVVAEYPDASATFYESEMYEDGSRVYEVEVRPRKGARCELAASAEGTELYRECEINPSKLPAPVSETIKKLFPKAKIDEAEHKTRVDGTESYAVEVTVNGALHYLYISPEGNLDRHLLRVPAVLEVPVN